MSHLWRNYDATTTSTKPASSESLEKTGISTSNLWLQIMVFKKRNKNLPEPESIVRDSKSESLSFHGNFSWKIWTSPPPALCFTLSNVPHFDFAEKLNKYKFKLNLTGRRATTGNVRLRAECKGELIWLLRVRIRSPNTYLGQKMIFLRFSITFCP